MGTNYATWLRPALGILTLCLWATAPFAATATEGMTNREAPHNATVAILVNSLVLDSEPTTLHLSALTPNQITKAKSVAAPNDVGIGRDLSPRLVRMNSQGRALLRITSDGASAVRVGLRFGAASYRLLAWADGDSQAVALDVTPDDAIHLVWSPITYGATQNILIQQLDSTSTEGPVQVVRVSHLVRAIGKDKSSLTVKDLGDSAPCQLDVVCLIPFVSASEGPAIVDAINSVPLLVITNDDGSTGLCSGTLLNSLSYPTPFLLTANHCVKEASELSSLLTLWFYVRTGCESGPVNPFTQVTGGATLLWSSGTLDGALIVLKQMPPSKAGYSGWLAGKAVVGDSIIALHHPSGDVLKASFGTVLGENLSSIFIEGIGNFAPRALYDVDWEVGFTEPGSSGSGLFTYSDSLRALVLRGTLSGAPPATCSTNHNSSAYSEFANQYPYVGPYLAAAPPPPPPPLPPPPSGEVQVVEYYNASLNHYFITPNATEIALLGKPPFDAWQPTGQSFLAYSQTSHPAGTTAVCRFFNDHFRGVSTHFYAPHGLGCEDVIQSFPDWTLEDPQLFYANLPDANGNCPAASVPVYRMYNNGMGGAPNHRFTISATVRQQMISAGYTPEGSGIGVGWCAPQ